MSVDEFADECLLLSDKQEAPQGGALLSEVIYSTDKHMEVITSEEAGIPQENHSIDEAEDFNDRLQFYHQHHHFLSRDSVHRKYRYCVCAYMLLCLLLIGAVIAFSLVVVLLLLPYVSTARYLHTTCTVTSVRELKHVDSCSCSRGCESRVPCVMIGVKYRDVIGDLQNQTVLHENDMTRDKQVRY